MGDEPLVQLNIQRIHQEVIEVELERIKREKAEGLVRGDVHLKEQDAKDLSEFLADFAYD